jgi:rfaE bifunctional protein kinase chain/domain/rfaE bifunctional protein nucleotidyltransferase chain/domain
MNKLFNLESLKQRINKDKNKGKKIVLCHGVFDLVHIGHIKHFESAKKFGDILVVTITEDKFINKGPGRPIFNSQIRAELISSFEVVDYVAISNDADATMIIKNLKPDIYCKGKEYKKLNDDVTGNIYREIKAIKSVGGKVKYTDDIIFSSSNLINNSSDLIADGKRNEFKNIRKYSSEDINKLLLKIKKLKVLVVGEAIIDQYQFCTAIGKSGKEPMLVFKSIKEENFAGGVLAIAQNISDYCSEVKVLSYLGEKLEYKKFIKENLSRNIIFDYIKKKKTSTIIKKRYVDSLSNTKLFGIYNINDSNLDKNEENSFIKLLNQNIGKYDLVLVSDYSHGLITKKIAKIICKKSKFLSLNAQINSSSIGYHTLSKYKNIDLLVINEGELRQEFRDKKSEVKFLIKKLSQLNKIKIIVVTQGREGSILFDNNKFYHCIAFADKIIDKVGAGDSMLSIMSIFAKVNKDHNLNLVAGSLAAADSVKNISNSSFFTKNKFLKNIIHMIK